MQMCEGGRSAKYCYAMRKQASNLWTRKSFTFSLQLLGSSTMTGESLVCRDASADGLACPLGAVGRMVGAWETEGLVRFKFSNALDLCLQLTC